MGLFDGIQAWLKQANTATPDQDSFVNRLGQFGARLQDIDDGGDRADKYIKQRADVVKAQQTAAQKALIAAKADELGLSPKEKFLLMVNPEEYSKLLSDQQKPYTIGDQRYGPNGLLAEAPKFMETGDQIVSATSQGVTPQYTRPPTIAEMLGQNKFNSEEAQRKINNDFERQRIGISQGQLGVAQGNLGVARGNLGVARDKLDYDIGGAGGALPPGYRPRR